MLDGGSSDGDGRFRLEKLSAGPVTIQASKQGFSPVEVAAEATEAGEEARPVELVLGRGANVSGRLLSFAGEPIGGRDVKLLPAGAAGFGDWTDPRTTTRADGSFAISGVPDGDYRVVVLSGFAIEYRSPEPVTVSGAPVADVEVRLPPHATIRGRLIGLEPESFPDLVIGARAEGPIPQRSGRVLADGTYEIADLPPATWWVYASVPNGGPVATSVRVTLEAGEREAEADLRFEPGLTLSGTVLRNGEPLVGVTVFVVSSDRRRGNSAVIGDDGRFRMGSLAAGRNVVHIRTPDVTEIASRVVDLNGDRDIVFALVGHRVAGVVMAADGSGPVEAAEVLSEQASSPDTLTWVGERVLTDADGRFTFDDLGEGTWRLSIRKEGFAEATVTVEVGSGDLELPAISLKRPPR
jgi:hypothetical protein